MKIEYLNTNKSTYEIEAHENKINEIISVLNSLQPVVERNIKTEQNGYFVESEWEKELMDEFCVMFERADRDGRTIDWVEKIEKFISNLLTSKLQEQRGGFKRKIRGLDLDGKSSNSWTDGYLSAVNVVLTILSE